MADQVYRFEGAVIYLHSPFLAGPPLDLGLLIRHLSFMYVFLSHRMLVPLPVTL